jgi:hypothetical protein
MLAVGTIGTLLIAAPSPASASPAAPTTGPGTVAVSSSLVLASSTGNNFTFTYAPTGAGISRGTLKLVIPGGWPAPQKKNSTKTGYVRSSTGKVAFSTSTVTLKKLTVCSECSVKTVNITYANVTAPAIGWISTFLTSAAAKGKKVLPLASSPTVTVATLPKAPDITSVTSGNGQLTVQLTAPTAFPEVSSYTVTCGTESTTIDSLTVTVTGLSNGTTYSCFAYATNAGGDGPDSASVNGTTNSQVPAAPTVSYAQPGYGQLTVVFTAPASPEPLTGYVATCGSFTGTAGPSALWVTVSGLNNGSNYNCTLYATDAAGNGPSAAFSGTPTSGGGGT